MIEENNQTLIFRTTEAAKMNAWLLDAVRPYIQGETVEIGSGQGLFSSTLASENIPVNLSDPKKNNRDNLRTQFCNVSSVKDVFSIDVGSQEFNLRYPIALGVFRTVISVNIIEYGYTNQLELTNLLSLLKPEGILIALAPAHTSIYHGLEQNLSAWKFYNSASLKHIISHNVEIVKTRYFSLIPDVQDPFNQYLGLSIVAVVRKRPLK